LEGVALSEEEMGRQKRGVLKTPPSCELEIAGGARLEVAGQSRSSLELRNGVEFFESGSEGVGEAPERSRLKLFVLGFEIQIVDTAGEMFGNFEFALDEGFVNEEFGGNVGEFTLAPGRDLLLHGFEASLHAVDADGDGIDEGEGFGVFGENGSVLALEGHIGTNEHPVAASHRETHGLVVRIPDSDGETATVDFGREVENAEHFHAVWGYCVFVVDGVDVAEAESFDQGLYDFVMRNRMVGGCGRRGRHQGEFVAADGACLISDECACV